MNVYLWSTELDDVALQSTWLDAIHLGTDEVWTSGPGLLCFTANTAWSTIKLAKNGSPTVVTLETSTDWNTWTTYTFWDTITLANIWDKVYRRNTSETDTGFSTTTSNYYKFEMTGSIAWSGDINFLLNKNSTTALSSYCYYRIFYWCSWLTSAPVLSSTTLATYCYNYMFSWCTWLTNAPALPATTLVSNCYNSMFYWCTWLTSAPVLPATTLAERCYQTMFYWCTSLTTAPTLPATTLANYCYISMFNWCTSLTTAPALPATTLTTNCYEGMFRWCKNLTSLPALPATTLTKSCYNTMFYDCSKIKLSTTKTWEYQTAYRIPTTWTWTTATDAVKYMFGNTWGSFHGEPTINTTYYTSNTVVS